ncbi:MAG TPA: nucleotidyltransferase [Thermoanaerobaculia bacterium]|nr:nucleotidyltransferase [Thermoanaerobaculia bacterium]
MSLLDEVSSTLMAAGVRHALIGALALSAYGVNRATVDLDLFVTESSCLTPDLWADLRSRGIAVEVRKGDMNDPLAGVVRLKARFVCPSGQFVRLRHGCGSLYGCPYRPIQPPRTLDRMPVENRSGAVSALQK